MRKRNIILIIIPIVAIVLVTLGIRLSIHNSKIRFLSDDRRQIEMYSGIYPEIISNDYGEKMNVKPDPTIYQNIVNHTAYVQSQKEALDDVLSSYSTKEPNNSYTISTSFDMNKSILSITVSSNDEHNITKYRYKLKTNKSKDIIKYKLLTKESEIE